MNAQSAVIVGVAWAAMGRKSSSEQRAAKTIIIRYIAKPSFPFVTSALDDEIYVRIQI
jgi:hypothetical protein